MYKQVHYHQGECPFCGQGQLLFVKECKYNIMLLMCDECEYQWENPEAVINGVEPLLRDNAYGRVTEATLDEIKSAGWEKFISKT